jgi:antitoxin ParD1/3/4
MHTMQISLPDPVKDFVDQQIANGRHSNAGDYIHGLIREDEHRTSQDQLESMLLDGLNSETVEMNSDDWLQIRADAASLLSNRRNPIS